MRCLSQLKSKLAGRTDPPFAFVSQFYDSLMEHVNYASWVEHIQSRMSALERPPSWVLDVACGTGTPTLLFAERGVRIVGLDRSLAMVQLARKKALDRHLAVPFAVQDMRFLGVRGKPDVILCLYDSVNFLLTDEDLRRAFSSAARTLAPGGLYLFDVVTERNIRLHFNGHTYREDRPGFTYEWTNRYDPASGICSSHLKGHCVVNGQKRPFHEFHQERIFPMQTIERCLKGEGFRVQGMYQAFTDQPVSASTNRIHFECSLDASV